MEYFSDKELGLKACIEQELSPDVWAGIVSNIEVLISSGAFGEQFPSVCDDGDVIIGTNSLRLSQAIKAEIPDIEWPLKTKEYTESDGDFLQSSVETPYSPNTLVALDLIQFCYAFVAKPIKDNYHSYWKHYHLSFDSEAGKSEFRNSINRIFSRNGVAYELTESGEIVRKSSPIFGENFHSIRFQTGDEKLDEILEDSRKKHLNPDPIINREAIERLWDAWERLKTLENPADKKKSIGKLLDSITLEKTFRDLLEDEAKKLTNIGNTFHIRHSEVTQIEIKEKTHVDYLFHRLFSMILLLIKTNG